MSDEGARRLATACSAAIERYAAKEREGINPDIFAELGESLFWLIALAEASGRHKIELFRGLRWARNRIAHGVLVTAPVEWQYGAELGRAVLGPIVLGTTSGNEWLPREDISVSRAQKSDPGGETAYDDHLAGRRVIVVLRDGLAEAVAP